MHGLQCGSFLGFVGFLVTDYNILQKMELHEGLGRL